jgi:ribosomal protein S18 acetylase RimI-like enzyme
VSKYVVRPAVAADAEMIIDFQIRMAWETEQKVLPRDRVEPGVRGVFADRSRGEYFVAEADSAGPVVASLLVTTEWSDWRNTDIWYIQSVYVDADHRGQGCFRQMYANVVEQAKQRNVRVVRLYVETDNSAAQQVYERLGMQRLPYHMYQMEW